MYKPRIIPCLLLRGNSLVKTIKFSNDVYIGDPVNAIRIFNEKEVDELVILDIEASLHSKDPNYELIEEMASEAFMPVAYGGGITKLSQAKHLIRAGIEKIVLNSSITVNPELMVQISETFGKQAIIASVDVRKSIFKGYKAYTHSGTKEVKESLNEYIEKIVSLGAGELLLNNIDRDGTMKGFDLSLINIVSNIVSIPLVACGGAGNIEDLRRAILEGGASAVAAGSMFVFYGKHKAVLINYPKTALY